MKTLIGKKKRLGKKTIRQWRAPRYRLKGLCVTCNKVKTCTFPKKRPVLTCEEFEGYPKIPVISFCQTAKPKIQIRPHLMDEYKGLCRDCDNRENCTFPKPEGGVWHCEEYR